MEGARESSVTGNIGDRVKPEAGIRLDAADNENISAPKLKTG
jgi:hypothetical protein